MNIELYSMRFISSSLGGPKWARLFAHCSTFLRFFFPSVSPFCLSLSFSVFPSFPFCHRVERVSADAIAGSSAAIVEKFPGEIEIDSRSAPKAILRRRVSSLTFSSFLVARAVIYEPSWPATLPDGHHRWVSPASPTCSPLFESPSLSLSLILPLRLVAGNSY